MHTTRRAFLLGAAGVITASAPAPGLGKQDAYSLIVHDVTLPVGTQGTLQASLRPREGYRILDGYNHRVIMLSSFDNDVKFARKMVPGEVQDGELVFAIGVTPTAPGAHTINGVIRVGYIQGGEEMSMISIALIAQVVGTA